VSMCVTAIIRALVRCVRTVADASPTKISIDAAVHSATPTLTAKTVGRPVACHIYHICHIFFISKWTEYTRISLL